MNAETPFYPQFVDHALPHAPTPEDGTQTPEIRLDTPIEGASVVSERLDLNMSSPLSKRESEVSVTPTGVRVVLNIVLCVYYKVYIVTKSLLNE